MVQHQGGFRSDTRRTLSKHPRDRGKISLTKLMQTFKDGERVMLLPEPAVHDAMPHPRYKGRSGIVVGMQGHTYKVQVMDGGVRKVFLCDPVHLKRLQ
jgi:large subunit ribosomal protein L21e